MQKTPHTQNRSKQNTQEKEVTTQNIHMDNYIMSTLINDDDQQEQKTNQQQESMPFERRQARQDRRNAHIAGTHINKDEVLIYSGIPPEFDRRKANNDRRTTIIEEKRIKELRKKSAKISKAFLKSIKKEVQKREKEERRNNLQEADLKRLIKSGVPPEYDQRKKV